MRQPEVDFKRIFESTAGLYLILDPTFQIVAVSDAYLQATMTRRERILGKDLFDVFPDNPNDPHATGVINLRSSLQRVLTTKKADRMAIQKYDIRRPDHLGGGFEVRFWSPVNTPIPDTHGNVEYIIHQVEDITEFIQLEEQEAYQRSSIEALKRERRYEGKQAATTPKLSEEKFRLLVESLPIGIWLLDTQGAIVYGNAAAQNTWKEIKYMGPTGNSEYNVWWPKDGYPLRIHEWTAMKALKSGKTILGEELKIQRFNGEAGVIANSVIPLFDDLNQIIGALVINQDITEQKRAEKELRKSEKLFRSIFDNSMDAVLLTTPKGHIIMANTAATELFGYSEKELQNLGRAAVVDPTDPQLIKALEERARAGQFRGELRFKRKDATYFLAEISSAVFRSDDGSEWTSMFIRDITERKETEEERNALLKSIEEKNWWIEALVERAPTGILLVRGENGETVIPNPGAISIFGQSVDWSQGLKAILGVVSETKTHLPLELNQLVTTKALAGEITTAQEELLCHPDGSTLPVLVNAGPIRDSTGKIIGAVAIFQDISKQKKAEEEREKALQLLDTEKKWLEAVFKHSPIGILLVRQEDPEHPIPNQYTQDIFGSNIDWKVGRSSYRGYMYNTEGKNLTVDELISSRVLHGETIKGEEILLRLPNGREFPILAAGGPIINDNNEQIGAVVFFQDITLLKELEQLREEWSAIIAHDLRQPITSIQLHAELLKTSPNIPKDILQSIELIESNAQQLQRMTRDLLEASQLEANKLQLEHHVTNIVQLLHQLIEKLSPVFSTKPIKLTVHGHIPEVFIDPGRIEQAIGNIISNASKYGFPGTDILLVTKQTENNIEISITNHGPGIRPDNLRKLFHRFERTSSASTGKVKGIGLGLYITKGLIEAHGGSITAESDPGKTTTFRIILPLNIS